MAAPATDAEHAGHAEDRGDDPVLALAGVVAVRAGVGVGRLVGVACVLSEGKYWVIAAILGVVTAIEVALSYIDLGDANAPLLLLGMALKFFIVASYFMHLKFDSRVTRRLFISGLFLAVTCYIGMLMMFRHFGPQDDRQDIHLVETGVPIR